MGVLAVWSARARDIVPHLTEQTTDVRAFQILVEAFRLWEMYAMQESQAVDRLREFFMLVEQAFARTIGWHEEGDWPLPGARRVRSRSGEDPCISIRETGWHLLDGQLANGIWGLYRGASARAGLLDEGMAFLSDETRQAAKDHTRIGDRARSRLFELVRAGMDGETVKLPTHGNDSLCRALFRTFTEVPLKHHLRAKLINGHDLNRALARRLAACESVDRRQLLKQAASDLHEHRPVLQDVIGCENLLAVVEAAFPLVVLLQGRNTRTQRQRRSRWIWPGLKRRDVRLGLRVRTPGRRQRQGKPECTSHLDTSSATEFARSVLALHKQVSDDRGRAPWVVVGR